jgi:hypothetical protein
MLPLIVLINVKIKSDSNLAWFRSLWDLNPNGGGTIILKLPTPKKKLEKQSTASISASKVSRTGLSP